MNITKLLEYIQNDKKLLKKALIVWLLFLATGIISIILEVFNVSTTVLGPLMDEDNLILFRTLTSVLIPISAQILLFPVSLYLMGYKYKVVKHGEVVEHDDIKDVFRYSLAYFISSFVVNLVFGLFFAVLIGIIALLVVAVVGSFSWQLLSGSILLIIILIFLLVIFAIGLNNIIVPSMMFVYLDTGKISDMFHIGLVSKSIRKNWRNFLLLVAINIALNAIMGMVGLVLCILGPLVSAAIEAATLLINGMLLGQIYSQSKSDI